MSVGTFAYTAMPADLVPMDRRTTARAVVDWCARLLGIASPEIIWLVPAIGTDPIEALLPVPAYGVAFSPPNHRVGLRGDILDGHQLVSTSAHECAHLLGPHVTEADADAFGWEVAALWCRPRR